VEHWKNNEYLLHRYKIILHRKKACCEVVVGNSARYLIELPIFGRPNPTGRGKRVCHDSLKVSCPRRGYCTQIALDPDEGDHRMDFHMYCVDRYLPYLLRRRCDMVLADFANGRLVWCLYQGRVQPQVYSHHIVGHGCMRIDSLWNFRHRVDVEVGEWGSSLSAGSSSAL